MARMAYGIVAGDAYRVARRTRRTVPGAVDVMGAADPLSTVTVNGEPASRQGHHFHRQLGVANASSPVYEQITVQAEQPGAVVQEEQGARYVAKTPEPFSYDFDGNLTQDGRWTYTWDGENRLVAMESIASAPTAAKKKLEFVYDSQWRRMKKSVRAWDSGTGGYSTTADVTVFYYDGWNLVGEGTGAGALTRTHLWGNDLSGTAEGAGGVGGLLASRIYAGGEGEPGAHFAISDANGNVCALVDGVTGAKTGEYEYSPFGEAIKVVGAAAKALPFRFSTKYEEPESGLVYYGYRYYAPGVGRWVSRDPEEQYISDYLFVRNASADLHDVLGLWGKDVHKGLTRKVAEESGFDRFGATDEIAEGDDDVDKNYLDGPFFTPTGQGRHLKKVQEGGQDSRTYWWKFEWRAAVKKLKEADDAGQEEKRTLCLESARTFGKALHSFQDASAHRQPPPYRKGLEWPQILVHPMWWDTFEGAAPPAQHMDKLWHIYAVKMDVEAGEGKYTHGDYDWWENSTQQQNSQRTAQELVKKHTRVAVQSFRAAVIPTCCRDHLLVP